MSNDLETWFSIGGIVIGLVLFVWGMRMSIRDVQRKRERQREEQQ